MDAYVVKYATQGLSTLYTQLRATEVNHRIEIVDPLSAMVRISLLKYKPPETKISIQENKIYIQEASWLQGASRWWNDDHRDNLFQLRYPILFFVGLKRGFIATEIDTEQLQLINQMVIRGLTNLRTTYGNSNGSMIRNCLDAYIKILSSDYSQDELTAEIDEINKPTLFAIYQEFMKHWNQTEIDLILRLFEYAETKDNDKVINHVMESINRFIDAKDVEIDMLRPGN